MSYRLDVIAASVPDAIRYAGGLMFDRGRAGWRVAVVTDDATHSRALAILGANTQSPARLEARPSGQARAYRIRVLPIDELTVSRQGPAAEDSEAEPRARLLFWGPRVTSESTGLLYAVRHDLSPAARTFKAHALHCAGLDTFVESSERFWANDALAADLFDDLRPDGQWPRAHAGGTHEQSRSPELVAGFPHG